MCYHYSIHILLSCDSRNNGRYQQYANNNLVIWVINCYKISFEQLPENGRLSSSMHGQFTMSCHLHGYVADSYSVNPEVNLAEHI